MTTLRSSLKWIAGAVVALIVLPALLVAVFGWNWLRGPIERMTLDRTGRELVIGGDLAVRVGWPHPRIHARAVTFANPSWASEKQMLSAEAIAVAIDLPQLMQKNLVFPDVRLTNPVIFLEQGADGRRNWLLDRSQHDERASIRVGRLMLDQGILGYDDAVQQTHIRAEVTTSGAQWFDAGLALVARGQYKGLPFAAHGHGGPVLGLRDERTPYPLKVEITVGATTVVGEGTLTDLLNLSAVDMRLAASGESLAQLHPLLGVALPETGAFAMDGHLVHSEQTWHYEEFAGRIGGSDMAGTLRLRTGGKRPAMEAEVFAGVLDIADVGALIGARPGRPEPAGPATTPAPSGIAALAPAQARMLPELAFKTDHWGSVDAEMTLRAESIRRTGELPLENLVIHLSLHDSVLRLEPVDFGVAGGHVNAVIVLDGRENPIQAHAKMQARKIPLSRLLPTIEPNTTSLGQVSGQFELSGVGNSARRMLASAQGTLGLVVAGGEISRLMMEKAGLHLWEILQLQVGGDERIKLHCAVADFDVMGGVMRARALIVDTEITTLIGSGSIDLGQEKFDLTLNQQTKQTSAMALRGPIHVRGSFASPEVAADTGHVAARTLGALMLGMINPLLMLIPLIDAGPGQDSDCAQLIRDASARAAPAASESPMPDSRTDQIEP